MNFIQEFALLFAIAVPVATIVGYNVVLAALGESGTLLFPAIRPFPAVALTAHDSAAPALANDAEREAANEQFHREAA